MANKLFKGVPVGKKPKNFVIKPPEFVSKEEIKAQEEADEEYKGPTLEEIQAEIKSRQEAAEQKLRETRRKAEEEANKILEQAETGAFQRIKSANDEYKKIIDSANRESEEITHKAHAEADKIVKEADEKKNTIDKQAYEAGYKEGMEKAYTDGKDQLNGMISRLEKILGETINKRNEIIESSEKQLTNIAIVITRKVVKAITESDQAVILRNVSEALRKIKGRAQVTIRVNISDLELTTRHKDDFYRMLDNIENVNVLEDPNIERGGCIIETDFGDVDARISAQLDEIETAIKNIQPIKDL
ncbi:MAG TPA: flagellar assembly protein FliH [Spirochaetota bacterium]|nr:flagellar assembly protein FliH [Spirochaetota bacterium]